MRLFAAVAIAAGATALAVSTAGAAPEASHPIRFLHRAEHVAQTSRVTAAARTTKTAGLNCIAACSLYESTINQFFTDVAADSGQNTNVYSVSTQYYSGQDPNQVPIQYSETFGGSFVDGNPYPTTNTCTDNYDKYCVTDKQLQAEISKVIAAHHWPTNSQTALYFVFTPAKVGVCIKRGPASITNACTTNVFCAYHSSTSAFIYAIEPHAASVVDNACTSGAQPAGNAADDTISTVSHEQNEAITDPLGDGWWSEDHESYMGIPDYFWQAENGDLCAYNFGTSLGTTLSGQQYNQLINGHQYMLQQEYSNAASGCVRYSGDTPTTIYGPEDPQYEGAGPLVYHGGHVMTTNTVYAIYWVPAKPANKQLPTISGTTKVGRTLRATHGAWSNLPKFTYRWLRCSPAGKSCTGIAKGSTYTLVDADAGHRIEVRVTATNLMGHASATSAPTGKVTG